MSRAMVDVMEGQTGLPGLLLNAASTAQAVALKAKLEASLPLAAMCMLQVVLVVKTLLSYIAKQEHTWRPKTDCPCQDNTCCACTYNSCSV